MPTKADYIYMGVGALGAVLLASYIPVLVTPSYARTPTTTTTTTVTRMNIDNMNIDSVSGIDIEALNIARQKGLI